MEHVISVTNEQVNQYVEAMTYIFGGLLVVGVTLTALIIIVFIQQALIMNDFKRAEKVLMRSGLATKMGLENVNSLKEFSKAIDKEWKNSHGSKALVGKDNVEP